MRADLEGGGGGVCTCRTGLPAENLNLLNSLKVISGHPPTNKIILRHPPTPPPPPVKILVLNPRIFTNTPQPKFWFT